MRLWIGTIATSLLLAATGGWSQPQEPPELSESKDYKHSWIDLEGVKAHYIEAGQGDPVVLVHGALPWSSAETVYGPAVGLLAKHFHTIAVDVVGFGYTTPRGPEHYTGKAQAEFVIKFLDALDLGPVVLQGNSNGGFITQYVAHERPDLVRRLIITNSLNGTDPIPPLPEGERYIYTPRRYYTSKTPEEIRQMLERYYKHKDLVTDERVRVTHDIYQRNWEYYDKRSKAVSYSVEAYNENLSYKGKHISEWASELKVPVLLVWSQPGSRVEWGVGHFFAIPGAEMHILPWSGHHLFTDQAARWSQVVIDWLTHEPARPPN
ncbi:MAG: alpha/beta fold hydrolase [Vicinamibacteria bacterium]